MNLMLKVLGYALLPVLLALYIPVLLVATLFSVLFGIASTGLLAVIADPKDGDQH